MAKYPAVLTLAAFFALAACDATDSGTPNPPPSNNVLLRYAVTGFGNYPASHASIIRYVEANGDTTEVSGATLPWSRNILFDPDTAPDTLYLRAWATGPFTALGLRVEISHEGVALTAQERDGQSGSGYGLNDIEIVLPYFAN